MRVISSLLVLSALVPFAARSADFSSGGPRSPAPLSLPGLHAQATVLRDVDGVPHVYAADEHDAAFMQGYLHANDRLFQLDLLRHVASGTAAELSGSALLPQDVELRTLGLRRAAGLSLAATSKPVRAVLQAYADGVNAWVATHPLPADYDRVQLTRIDPWTPLDSVAVMKLIVFQLSFDFDTDRTLDYLTYQKKLVELYGVSGAAKADSLFNDDVFRSAPFDPASTVPDANGPAPLPACNAKPLSGHTLAPGIADMLRDYQTRLSRSKLLDSTRQRRQQQIGSNEWAVAGGYTRNGRPLVANDPHLSLGMPSNFYDQQLQTRDGLDVIGSSLPGVPMVVLGQTSRVAWGLTTAGFDVTDAYAEKIVPDAASPSGLSTVYLGNAEPIVPIPITFKVNLMQPGQNDVIVPVPAGNGMPAAVLLVPRHGPIVQLDANAGTAISIQWAGATATRELDAFYLINRARSHRDVKAALQYFDVGSQNFAVGDIDGHIAYYTSGEIPLREDLQAGAVAGAPPWFVRNGQGGNEWLRKAHPGPTDGTGFDALPFAELPQVVDPRAGFFVNANNDPAGLTLDNNPLNQLRTGGQGIYYLGIYNYDQGTRAGRITELLRQHLARGPVDAHDMAAIQADVTMLDAEVFTPLIVQAFDSAHRADAPGPLLALASDPRVIEAVGRLRHWSGNAPTGIATGYDGADRNGRLGTPRQAEVDASVAATIYSTWRGQAVANGVDHALHALGLPLPKDQEALKALRHVVQRHGVGISGIDFFNWVPLTDAAQKRDYVLLKSLQDALNLLSGPSFARAFNGSTKQGDYRWGKLHRITFESIAGFADHSIPGATPGFEPSVPGLPGIAVDGGLGTVDIGGYAARAADDGAFTFAAGANRRYVGSVGSRPGSIDARSILAGGESGVLGNPFYANMLGRWLTNDTYPFRTDLVDVLRELDSYSVYEPVR